MPDLAVIAIAATDKPKSGSYPEPKSVKTQY